MAAMIGKGKSWLFWLAGFLCALVFGRSGLAREAAVRYGITPRPPAEGPDKPAEKPAASLEESADWKAIAAAWDFCMPLASSGKSTEAQRKEADGKLKAAREAAERLAGAGFLAAAEAGLLAAETDKIRADIYRNPPTDRMVECHQMAYLPPAQQSFDRLAKRLPLLEKLAEGGKIHKPAVEKVLATVEADLAVLSDEKQLGRLTGEKRVEAGKTRDAVKAQVEKLGKLLEAGGAR
ncbi:MAG TPA: hypothetical protein PK280_00090 [Planctomycetota bacterium]|nr:hypothetical protein [Planctomycetota bacterium]